MGELGGSKVLRLLKDGQFEAAYPIIQKQKLNDNDCLKYIGNCAYACSKNDDFNDTYLTYILKYLIARLTPNQPDAVTKLISNVYHIVDALLKKNSLEAIISLRDVLLSDYVPDTLTAKETARCMSIPLKIYSHFVKLCTSNNKTFNHILLELADIFFAICNRLKSYETACSCIQWFFSGFMKLEIDPEKISRFYVKVLTSLEGATPSCYKMLLKDASILLPNLYNPKKKDLMLQCFKQTEKRIKQLFPTKEYTQLNELLDMINWIFSPFINCDTKHTPEPYRVLLSDYYAKHGPTEDFQAVCELLTTAAVLAWKHYKNSPSWWVDKTPSQEQCEYYKFLQTLAEVFIHFPFKCPLKHQCELTTNIASTLPLLDVLLGLQKLAITKSDTSQSYKLDMVKYVALLVFYVQKIQLTKCTKWETSYYNGLITAYNTGIHLYKVKDMKFAALFFKTFIKYNLQIEGTSGRLIGESILKSALSMVADIYLQAKDYDKCLGTIAFNLAIHPNLSRSDIGRAVTAKVAARNDLDLYIDKSDLLQKLTFVGALETITDEITLYYPGFKLDSQKELLIQELRLYKEKWASKVPMFAVLKELSEVADPETLADIIVEIWGSSGLQVDSNFLEFLNEFIRKYEPTTIPSLTLAHLYYLQHKSRIALLSTENLEIKDPEKNREEGDVVVFYECLNMDRYSEIMTSLNRSLEVLVEVLKKDKGQSQAFPLLMRVGSEFEMHSHSAKALIAWEWALKVVLPANDKSGILEASSAIIKIAKVHRPLVKKIVAGADEAAAEMEETAHIEELIVFYLSKALGFFWEDINVAKEAFYKAMSLYEKTDKNNLLISAKVHYVHYKFLMLPCDMRFEGHEKLSILKIHEALSCICKNSNTREGMSVYSDLMDISETIAKLYNDLNMPREVCCYTKDAILVAQKLCLPLRVAKLVFYVSLAYVQLHRLSDSRVKIMGLLDFLGAGKAAPTKNSSDSVSPFECNVDEAAVMMEEMIISCEPVAYSTNSGSPRLKERTFKAPAFVNHPESCQCLHCTCLEYQVNIIKATFLFGHLLLNEGTNISAAFDYLGGALKMANALKSRRLSYVKKFLKNLSPDLLPLSKDSFVEVNVLVMLEYTNYYLRIEAISKAETANTNLLVMIEPFKATYLNLYIKAIAQTMTIKSGNFIEPDYLDYEACEEVVISSARTPESKSSHVIVKIARTPDLGDFQRPKRIIKPARFNLFDDDDDEEEEKVTKNKHTVPKIKVHVAKTPSVKKRKVLTEVASSGGRVTAKDLFGFTGTEMKAKELLAPRTRLLTEKLKGSAKKSRNDENVAGPCEKREERPGRSNLLNKLSEVKDGPEGGARRSNRNKK